jgi:hypothetical protein
MDSMRRLNAGVLMATGVVVIAGASFLGSLRLPYYTEYGPDAGFFPYWVSLCLCAVGAALLFDAFVHPPELQTSEVVTMRQGRAVVSFAAYVACLSIAGFAIATALLLFFVVAFAERRRYWVAGLYAIATTAALVWLFQEMFRLPLPQGMVW